MCWGSSAWGSSAWENGAEENFEVSGGVAEDAVQGFASALRGVNPGALASAPLRVAMTNFADITLHQTAFQVFAIRVSCVAQIVGERNEDSGAHLPGSLAGPRGGLRFPFFDRSY